MFHKCLFISFINTILIFGVLFSKAFYDFTWTRNKDQTHWTSIQNPPNMYLYIFRMYLNCPTCKEISTCSFLYPTTFNLFFSLPLFIYCVGGRGCIHGTSYMWRSEDNLKEIASIMQVLGIDLGSSGLTASTYTNGIISLTLALFWDKLSLIQAGLEFTILLLQPPECGDHGVLHYFSFSHHFKQFFSVSVTIISFFLTLI